MSETLPDEVIVGVDTHKHVHAAVAIDGRGARLGATTIPVSGEGYRALEAWARSMGPVRAFGVEGTGSYGAGLPKSGTGAAEMIRHLKAARDTAVKARTQAMVALKALIVAAPAALRERLERLGGRMALVRHLAGSRPG